MLQSPHIEGKTATEHTRFLQQRACYGNTCINYYHSKTVGIKAIF